MSSLSFKKLSSMLATKYMYVISSVYLVEGSVYFIEVRTPLLQKTFIIRIPEKYTLTYDTDAYKSVDITPVAQGILPGRRQTEYLMEIKGTILTCDIISISSTAICLYRNNGDVLEYVIGKRAMDIGDDSLPEEDEMKKLIGDACDVIRKDDPDFLLPSASEDYESDIKEDDILTKKVKVIDPWPPGQNKEVNSEERIELEFVEDEVVEEQEEVVDVLAWPSTKVHKSKKTSAKYRKDNSLPPLLEEANLLIGVIYISIDLSDFYRLVHAPEPSFEQTIITSYDVLDDNESEMRDGKIDIITTLCERIILTLKQKIDGYKKKELEWKEKILTLSSILEKTEGLRVTKPSAEVDKIYQQTKSTIYDVNIEMLKIKDEMDSALGGVQSVLEDLVEL